MTVVVLELESSIAKQLRFDGQSNDFPKSAIVKTLEISSEIIKSLEITSKIIE